MRIQETKLKELKYIFLATYIFLISKSYKAKDVGKTCSKYQTQDSRNVVYLCFLTDFKHVYLLPSPVGKYLFKVSKITLKQHPSGHCSNVILLTLNKYFLGYKNIYKNVKFSYNFFFLFSISSLFILLWRQHSLFHFFPGMEKYTKSVL